MANIIQYFTRTFTTTKLDIKAAQVVVWSVALVVMIGGIYTLARFQLTEAELFLGILLVMAVSLQVIVGGLLLPIVACVAQQQKDNHQGGSDA